MPTYTPLQSIELTATASSVIFSNIPQTYQDLVLVMTTMDSGAGATSTNLQFNSDTGSNYSFTHVGGNGTSAGSFRDSNRDRIQIGAVSTTSYTPAIIHIMNYSNSTTFKTILSRNSLPDYASLTSASAFVGLWRNTSAITTIRVDDNGQNFAAGSTFDLYGISPVAAQNAQAFGGTDIYYDSTYVYHVFKGSGTFTPYRNLTCDYLVVAGGGGSNAYSGGGGGAGGFRAFTNASFTANTSYPVTIGAGGTPGSNGNNSSFNSNSSTGGGYGANGGGGSGGSGGSGGGAGGQNGGNNGGGTGNSNSYSPVEGYNGASNNYQAGGGGGGAAEAAPAVSSTGTTGRGGDGTSAYSSWGAATGTGELVSGTYYYAGGGAGGMVGSRTAGRAGYGGGGAASNSNGTSGKTNTGGGGGGGTDAAGTGSSGGSGLVIIRYAR